MTDFWRMVWENDASIIVMLANIIENGRVRQMGPHVYAHRWVHMLLFMCVCSYLQQKCAKYWPPVEGKDSVSDRYITLYHTHLTNSNNVQVYGAFSAHSYLGYSI
jgi:protein tyrosine phosphatase